MVCAPSMPKNAAMLTSAGNLSSTVVVATTQKVHTT